MNRLGFYLHYFGYADHPDNGYTAFYKYENPKPEWTAAHRGYAKNNEEAIKFVIENTGKLTKGYGISQGVVGTEMTREYME